MKCQVGLPSITKGKNAYVEMKKRPVVILFDIPYFTVSGLQVRYLKISEKSNYPALPWVRYITQSGDYLVKQTK
jgi:AP-1 complex subunit mu